MTVLVFVASVVTGAVLWTLAEYLLHRFAMHHLHGRGIMSREHLEHHVRASWTFARTTLLSWAGIVLVGALVWLPLGWLVTGPAVGAGLALGWAVGYAGYEWVHARSHLVPPRGPYGRWLRRHHLHHHFGHPMANHGVSVGVWDRVFGTHESPDVVRVPRRLALSWMVGPDGELLDAYADDYVLVGRAGTDDAVVADDRRRAFASIAPAD